MNEVIYGLGTLSLAKLINGDVLVTKPKLGKVCLLIAFKLGTTLGDRNIFDIIYKRNLYVNCFRIIQHSHLTCYARKIY